MEPRPHVIVFARLLALVATFSLTVVEAQSCGFNGYDFSKEFTGQVISAPDLSTGYTGEVTPCAKPTAPTTCDSTLTQKDMANKIAGTWCYGVIAKLDDSGVWSYVNGKDHDDGVMVSYKNGDPCFSGDLMTMDLIFQCSLTGASASFTFLDGFDQCQAQFIVPSELACDSPGGGLGAGWIFVIVVLVSFAVYLIGGCAYKMRQHGTKGVESTPNIEFWREVPGLVKDGTSYTWEKIRGNRGSYNDVKDNASSF